jgi:hypothetical protein
MGTKTQGDIAAALLAASLKNWEVEKRRALFHKFGLMECRSVKGQHSHGDTHVLTHVGGTGLLCQEGFIRPQHLQVWAQEYDIKQVKHQSLIGWAVNGLMRNENLELLPEYKNSITQKVHVPASDSVVSWWLRSEGSNSWVANCDNLQWGGVAPLALLLCMLDTSEDDEMEDALNDLLQNAQLQHSHAAAAVAADLENAFSKIAGNHEAPMDE